MAHSSRLERAARHLERFPENIADPVFGVQIHHRRHTDERHLRRRHHPSPAAQGGVRLLFRQEQEQGPNDQQLRHPAAKKEFGQKEDHVGIVHHRRYTEYYNNMAADDHPEFSPGRDNDVAGEFLSLLPLRELSARPTACLGLQLQCVHSD